MHEQPFITDVSPTSESKKNYNLSHSNSKYNWQQLDEEGQGTMSRATKICDSRHPAVPCAFSTLGCVDVSQSLSHEDGHNARRKVWHNFSLVTKEMKKETSMHSI